MKYLTTLPLLIWSLTIFGQTTPSTSFNKNVNTYANELCNASLLLDRSAINVDFCGDELLEWLIKVDLNADGNLDRVYYSGLAEDHVDGTSKTDLSGSLQIHPKDTPFYYIPPTASGEKLTGRAGEALKIDLGSIKGKTSIGKLNYEHLIEYRIYDACSNFTSRTDKFTNIDNIPPSVKFDKQVINTDIDPDQWDCTTDARLDTFSAKHFVISIQDNCDEEFYHVFEEELPVLDTLIWSGTAFHEVNPTTSHYFNKNGFVDFGYDEDQPQPKELSIARFNRQEISYWDSQNNSTLKIEYEFFVFRRPTIKVCVSDQSLNLTCDTVIQVNYNKLTDLDNIDLRVNNIYPNPFQDHLTIEIGEQINNELMINILDLQGKTVLQNINYQHAGSSKINIELGDLPTGHYILSLNDGTKQWSRQIQKR